MRLPRYAPPAVSRAGMPSNVLRPAPVSGSTVGLVTVWTVDVPRTLPVVLTATGGFVGTGVGVGVFDGVETADLGQAEADLTPMMSLPS